MSHFILALIGTFALLITFVVWYTMITSKPTADHKPLTPFEWVLAILLIFGPPFVALVCFSVVFL